MSADSPEMGLKVTDIMICAWQVQAWFKQFKQFNLSQRPKLSSRPMLLANMVLWRLQARTVAKRCIILEDVCSCVCSQGHSGTQGNLLSVVVVELPFDERSKRSAEVQCGAGGGYSTEHTSSSSSWCVWVIGDRLRGLLVFRIVDCLDTG